MNNIDDANIGRNFPNKKIEYLFSNPKTSNLIDELEHNNILRSSYYRNTCTTNSYYVVNENEAGYIGAGGNGIVRHGKYIDARGVEKNGAFKIFISTDDQYNPYDGTLIMYNLMEIKYGIELMKSIPESVVHIELVNSCKILKSYDGEDKFLEGNDLFIIAMEYGEPFIDYFKSSDIMVFSTMLSKSMDALDNLNRHGYYHRDVKLQNIIVVNRNGSKVPVIIDFGRTDYFDNDIFSIPQQFQNIPVDAFYLGLVALHNLNYEETYSSKSEKKLKKKVIFCLCWKFYRILNTFNTGNPDELIVDFANEFNDWFWDENVYGMRTSFSKFKKLLNKYHPQATDRNGVLGGPACDLIATEIRKYITNRLLIFNSKRIHIPDPSSSPLTKQYFINLLKNELSNLPSLPSVEASPRSLPEATSERSSFPIYKRRSNPPSGYSSSRLKTPVSQRVPLRGQLLLRTENRPARGPLRGSPVTLGDRGDLSEVPSGGETLLRSRGTRSGTGRRRVGRQSTRSPPPRTTRREPDTRTKIISRPKTQLLRRMRVGRLSPRSPPPLSTASQRADSRTTRRAATSRLKKLVKFF